MRSLAAHSDPFFKVGTTDWDHLMSENGHKALNTPYLEGWFVGVPKEVHPILTKYRAIFEKEFIGSNYNIAISLAKREDIITQLTQRRNTTLRCIDQTDEELKFYAF